MGPSWCVLISAGVAAALIAFIVMEAFLLVYVLHLWTGSEG
jgi:hypothetical protein